MKKETAINTASGIIVIGLAVCCVIVGLAVSIKLWGAIL